MTSTHKVFKYGWMILLLLVLGSCGLMDQPKSKAVEYFPIQPNTRYTYIGSGNEYASYTSYVDYIAKDRYQIRIENGGTIIDQVILHQENQVVQLYYDASKPGRESYLYQNIQSAEQPEILLMDPIRKGTTWELANGDQRTITAIDVPITTPLGNYQAIEVSTQTSQGIVKQYYIKDIGLVQTIFEQEEGEITSALTAIDANASLKETITFYLPSISQDTYFAIPKEVIFQTNDNTLLKIEETYQSIADALLPGTMELQTHMESVTRTKENAVTIDLTETYYEEIADYASYEKRLIQCLVNTIGQYYGVSKVYVTVGGEPYQSSQLTGIKGFDVDLSNVIYP